ncbi:EAL domain-containing protein [Leptothermofonsia sichuanensis E412]|uniref:EAL domain-containing protein n=1 Tax=Leptothermofonsia sichuanensis TaxID=2917832 RepID=UPI001CA6B448|nr:EAL domain-containing protein [Leptothermofonsia sichuanensis]QZZ19262.1 EAL domain-containing protein [Leptothermofonsia sichuanensis E412]
MSTETTSQPVPKPVDLASVSPGFSLPPQQFAAVFPFHIVFNRKLEILQIGNGLQQVYPSLSIGAPFGQHFQINRPGIQTTFESIQQHTRSLFMLESLQNGMQLKGQMVYVCEPEVIVFLGSPWITQIASLKAFGLSLKDFAIHDPIADFLFLLQAQNTALADAKKLTDQLTQQRSELRKTNQKLAAQYAVTHILAEASCFNQAIVKILEAIGHALDWQLGALWVVDGGNRSLQCQELWQANPEQYVEFTRINRQVQFASGVGLPGQVWQSGEAVWVEDLCMEHASPRSAAAHADGVHGGFALPIKHGSQVIGVMEFFSHKTCQPDDGLLEMMADIGIKIGQFVQRKQTEEALLKQIEISAGLKSILDSMGDAVLVADENEKFLVFNPAAERMFGSRAVNLKQWFQELGLCLPNCPTPWDMDHFPLKRSIRGEDVNDVEMLIHHPNAPDGLWITVTGRPLRDQHGNLKGGVIVCRDITERKQVEEKLLHDAYHDGLTGLANRALFMERLQRAIASTKQHKNHMFSVLFLDLDRFKVINDSLGHIVGDQLLIAISRRLEACLRPRDTIARLGGDEFAILLENLHDSSDAIQIAERLQKALVQPFDLNGIEIFASISIGIASSTIHYDHPQELLRDADTAMYHAKALGKSRYQIFDKTMHTRAVTLLQIETDLRRAIERQEFRLHYQPIVNLHTHQIMGFEALIRWHHPERGLISPAEFIPIAEETGLIIPIDLWLLREACHQMRHWQMQLPQATHFTISVNISGKQFSQPNLIEQVKHILRETGLDACCLKLEITESVLVANADIAIRMLQQLQALGIQLSIDDFGTGYSSLSYLHRFPMNTLKIDRSFTKSIGADPKKLGIIKTVVSLAQNLGMDVIAEGVETSEQVSQLKVLNCTSAQGFFFSKPLDEKTAQGLISKEPQIEVSTPVNGLVNA